MLDSVRSESLGISILFDDKYYQETILSSDTCVSSASNIKETVVAFKQSLQMSPSHLRNIEQSTREQHKSSLWFSARRYRITASHFGEILHCRKDTLPDRLVLSILKPSKLSTPATIGEQSMKQWPFRHIYITSTVVVEVILLLDIVDFLSVINMHFLEQHLMTLCMIPQILNSYLDFWRSNASIHIEIVLTVTEACGMPRFCFEPDTQSDGSQLIKLRHSHPYYAQVQGQMAVGDRTWHDFVIYTKPLA